MTRRAQWIAAMRGASAVAVWHALGREGDAQRGLYGCPACGAETRHRRSRDRRGAVLTTPDGQGWRCLQCDASGDGLDLVALVLRGRRMRDLSGDTAQVREWVTRYWGGAAATTTTQTRRPARRAPVPGPVETRRTEPPPQAEVQALWDSCRRCDKSEPVRAWCARKGLDATGIADRDLARALPPGRGDGSAPLPEWTRFGRESWRRLGYHLITPLYDVAGTLRSVIARCVIEPRRFRDGASAPKSVPPKGYGRSGLVMACPMARQVLKLGRLPIWWGDHPATLYMLEGEGDYLRAAAELTDADEHAPMCMGIVAGSITTDLIARIPDGVRLVVATDDDEAGDRYTAQMLRVAAQRVRDGSLRLERWIPHPRGEAAAA